MKSTAAAVVAALLLVAQVDAVAIRPTAIRPGSILARPSIPSPAIAARPCVVIDETELEQLEAEEDVTVVVEQPQPKPAVINVGQIIKPTPIQGGGPQVLLPVGRPLKPSDLIRPANEEDVIVNTGSLTRPTRPINVEEDVPFGGHGSSISTKPSRPVVVFPWIKPADINQQSGGQDRPAILPIKQEDDQPQFVLLPNDRPLRPSDLIPGSQQQQKPAVKPIPINQQVGGNGPDQFIPIRPRPVIVEQEQADEQQFVLLPNDRPLRPSDLIPGSQQQQKPAVKPIPINQQVGGNGPDQFIPIRPRPVIVEQEQADEQQFVLLPNDRPLRPSDLIPADELRPIFIKPNEQQNWSKYPDNYLPARPLRPVNDIIF